MKKKVILFSTVNDPPDLYMPLWAISLGGVIKQEGGQPIIIDVQTDAHWKKRLVTELKGCLLFCLSCLTSESILAALDAIEIVRKNSPKTPIVWGGYHATLAYQGIFKEGLTDYVVKGYGERGLSRIYRAYTQYIPGTERFKRFLHDEPSIVFNNGNDLIDQEVKSSEIGISHSCLDYSLIEVEKYYRKDQKHVSYISSYGCPFACKFCAEPHHSRRKWSALSAKKTVSDLIDLWEKYRPERISILDPVFTVNTRRIVEIVKELKSRGKYIELMIDMRVSDIFRIQRKIPLKELREVGLVKVFIGVESGSNRVLAKLKKGVTREEIYEGCQLLNENDIQSYTSFIYDMPGEEMSDIDKTLSLARELAVLKNNRQFHHFYAPFPNTALYEELVKKLPTSALPSTQREWAKSSTYSNRIWPGRIKLKRYVCEELERIKAEFLHAFKPGQIPILVG